ncbi:MAG: transcriptional regulator [Candidatus Bathyarchaeia archaeon]
MRPPCELIVKRILPAFRSIVANELVKNYSFSQTEAARMLGTTQAAISQYFHSKRGNKMVRMLQGIPRLSSTASKMAKDLANGEASQLDALKDFCKLCQKLRASYTICKIHKDTILLPEFCDVCSEILR